MNRKPALLKLQQQNHQNVPLQRSSKIAPKPLCHRDLAEVLRQNRSNSGDPLANRNDVHSEYNLTINSEFPTKKNYSAVILAVPHDSFVMVGPDKIKEFSPNGVFFDLKSVFSSIGSDLRL